MRLVAALLFVQVLYQQYCYGENNWLIRQKNYVSRPPQNLQDRQNVNSDGLIQSYAVNMEDMGNFNLHLNKILIPRVPGTKGSEIVRKHI